ncbi:hypothetical protein [Candidatus Entotheonella palauensis]|uniref:hypothetical protein n=1 Tax=Candidatus Entotheonella palauensis TaxID=93172 RepID=UPI000B7E2007|nr:hypothetical protein [Candidatus Entotheonella palauensis]
MLDLRHIHPSMVNDHMVKLADEDDDLAIVCNLFQAHRVLPGLAYRAIGMGLEGAVGLYLCNSATVPESVHHLRFHRITW